MPGAERLGSPMTYAEAVRRAAAFGEAYQLFREDLKRMEDETNLGFSEPRYVDIYPRVKPARTKSVSVAPLEKADGKVDVILVIANPARIMNVVQVFNRLTGEMLAPRLKGIGAVVSGEATALPYVEGRPNLTLLCPGDRVFGGYRDDELMIGFPSIFSSTWSSSLRSPTRHRALRVFNGRHPNHMKEAFSWLGLDKATDHFFGEVEGRSVGIYVGKDESGTLSRLTIYYPCKLGSEEEAKKIASKLSTPESLAEARGSWLDLAMVAEFKEGVDRLALDRERFKREISSRVSYLGGPAGGIQAALSPQRRALRRSMGDVLFICACRS